MSIENRSPLAPVPQFTLGMSVNRRVEQFNKFPEPVLSVNYITTWEQYRQWYLNHYFNR